MNARYREARVGACLSTAVEQRADGTTVLRSHVPLEAFPTTLTQWLDHWAVAAPERTFVAKRSDGGDWRRISYREMRQHARAIGAALVARGLSAERPAAILSENDLEHLMLSFGALYAGVPIVPISPA